MSRLPPSAAADPSNELGAAPISHVAVGVFRLITTFLDHSNGYGSTFEAIAVVCRV